jgi:hypothetical protein
LGEEEGEEVVLLLPGLADLDQLAEEGQPFSH